MSEARKRRVVLYARPDCHLCDEARAGLERMRDEGEAFEVEEIDIESDDAVFKRYLERIPVIELDGDLVSELGLDPDALRARLATVRE